VAASAAILKKFKVFDDRISSCSRKPQNLAGIVGAAMAAHEKYPRGIKQKRLTFQVSLFFDSKHALVWLDMSLFQPATSMCFFAFSLSGKRL
jgi:hypothetical protein